ncbi:MAG: ABC transporter permease [Alphaproteobacteria bacterium MedPE-SWcel]|nr:MAG: ABC transporter permease [Alphaproteobacteria bacterium MedPE-SWcel]
MTAISFILAGMLAAATPFLLAALGELVAERSGVLNLGVEGMMALGAAVGFITVYSGGGHVMGFVFAGLSGSALALVFAFVTLGLHANQVAAGLAIGILGLGLSAYFGKPFESFTVTGVGKIGINGLVDLPVIGGLFRQDIVVWLSLIFAPLMFYTLKNTKLGLVLRAVGENPEAADAIGYPVTLIRLCAVAFGGLMAGVAGAYASTIYTPLWADGMIAGRGWIAVALVVYGTWMVGRVFVGACLFGAVSLGGIAAQTVGLAIPSQLLASLPYVVTIIVLGIISSNRRLLQLNGIKSLGEVFEK